MWSVIHYLPPKTHTFWKRKEKFFFYFRLLRMVLKTLVMSRIVAVFVTKPATVLAVTNCFSWGYEIIALNIVSQSGSLRGLMMWMTTIWNYSVWQPCKQDHLEPLITYYYILSHRFKLHLSQAGQLTLSLNLHWPHLLNKYITIIYLTC